MNKQHRELIRERRVQFIQAIVDTDCLEWLIDELLPRDQSGYNGLTWQDLTNIKGGYYTNEAEKVEEFLEILCTRGPIAIDRFFKAIIDTKQAKLISILTSQLPPNWQTGNERTVSSISALAPSFNHLHLSTQQSLKNVYLKRFKKVFPYSLPFTFDVENTWVSLALKEEKKISQATEDHAELLKRAFEKTKMFIIEGNPATGKTSLMRRLACEWAKGNQHLLCYDLVLYAEFRKVREEKFESIAELVLYYSKTLLKKESYEKLEQLMNNEQFCDERRILVLLDGYDESSLGRQCLELTKYLFVSTSDSTLLFNVVITTRKGYLSNFRGFEGQCVFAEVLGFTTKQQKEKYICNHYLSHEIDNRENMAEVRHLLDNNEYLNNLAETPLFLTFICLVHERIIDGTLVELYCNIIWWLIDRHQQAFFDHDTPCSLGFPNNSGDKFETIRNHYLHFPQLYYLGNMALHKLQENVFKYSDCARFHLQPITGRVGLLRKEKKYDNSFKLATSFFFPHRTIQEFLAAFYCFCSYDLTSEWLLRDSKLDTSKMNEFERFLLRIALSDKMPIQTEKRKYYFERITEIYLNTTFDAFNTTAGFNYKLLNWFFLQCRNVLNIHLSGKVTSVRQEMCMLNDTFINNESASTSKISSPTLISFSDLTKFHSVTFAECTFKVSSQLSFTNCPSLKNLKFVRCDIESSTNLGIETLPAIDTVDFYGCNIDMAAWQSITAQIWSSSVQFLKLSNDYIVKETYSELLQCLQKCERIEEIHVWDFYDLKLNDYILNHYEEEITTNLSLIAQKLPRLKSIIIIINVDSCGRRLSERNRERIEKAGQERNPDFSIKYVEQSLS